MAHAQSVLSANAVHVTGSGPPLVFVHGFGCDQTMWNQTAPGFTKDHQVILYDLTGMGNSDYAQYDTKRHGKLDGHAEDLIEILDTLQTRQAVAIGHSVSAVIIGLAAVKRPDLFRGLVMIGPSFCYIDKPPYHGGFSESDIRGLIAMMDENYLGWAGQLASLVAGPGSDEAEQQLEDRFCRNDPEISKHFAMVTFLSDNRGDLPRIQPPTLIIQSAHDVIADPRVGQYVHEQIPHSELVKIDSTGHAPHMTHPAEVTAAMRNFLAGL